MRKNISVTNERVLKAMEKSENASKLIENAMIYYLDQLEAEFVTREEFEILNDNFTQQRDLLVVLSKAILGGK